MNFNNFLNVAKIRLGFIISATIFLISLAMILFVRNLEWKIVVQLFSGAAFILYWLLHFIQPYYVSFVGKNKKMQIKYFYAHPFMRRVKGFEFTASTLIDFEIRSSFFDLKHKLYLTVKTNKTRGEYPPISISALPLRHRQVLERELTKLIAQNKRAGLR